MKLPKIFDPTWINIRNRPAKSHLLKTFFAWGWVMCCLGNGLAFEVEFPGPEAILSLGEVSSAVTLPWPGAEGDYLITGGRDGFLSLVRLLNVGNNFNVLYRQYLAGDLMAIIPWENFGTAGTGIIVATMNPDRVFFVEVNPDNPYFAVRQQIDLPEDPGTLAFVGPQFPGGQELAVSLPGVDQVGLISLDTDTWSLSQIMAAGDRPVHLVGLDLEDDGIREIVTADRGVLSGSLGIFRRDAGGQYGRTAEVDVPGLPAVLATEDIDGDLRPELVVGVADAPEAHVLVSAEGTLTLDYSLNLTLPAEALHLAPLPAGQLGLFTAVQSRGLVEVLGYADGLWTAEENYYPGCRPQGLTSGDFNGDNLEDLVCLGNTQYPTTVLFGNHETGFLGFPALTLNNTPGASVLADFSGDGIPDLVVAGADSPSLSYFPGQPDGGLSPVSVDQELSYLAGGLVALEAGGSSGPELALLDLFTGQLRIMDFDETSGFQQLASRALLPFPQSLESADLDQDGHDDLFMARRTAPDLMVLFGDGGGGFSEEFSLPASTGAENILALDLNADTLLDLVVVDGVSRVQSFVNQGDRTFAGEAWVIAGNGARYLATGDLDGDGDLDVVVANRTEESLTFLENDGSGALVRRIGSHALEGRPLGVVSADLNKSGNTDVLVNLGEEGNLGLIFGLGDWAYGSVIRFAGGASITSTQLGDFNLDGYPDVLNLDQSLRLGLTMLNVEPPEVAVDPHALTFYCGTDQLHVEILPDRDGPWDLDVGGEDQWQSLVHNGQAEIGHLEHDGRRYYFSLSRTEWGQVLGPALRTEVLLRLVVGQGENRETLELPVTEGCLEYSSPEIASPLTWAAEPWPNPFNPRLQSRISLAVPGYLSAAVYDLAGRLVEVLFEGQVEAGVYTLAWDGTSSGRPLAGGVYFLKVKGPSTVLSRKVLLLK